MPNELTSDLIRQLLDLPYEQREQLADTLINSLHPSGEPITAEEWRTAWTEECDRRMMEIESGELSPISADDLIRQLRAKHSE